MKILTNEKLNMIISKAKTEVWDEMRNEQKLDSIEHRIYKLEERVLKLEGDGGMPKLEQTDCPWK